MDMVKDVYAARCLRRVFLCVVAGLCVVAWRGGVTVGKSCTRNYNNDRSVRICAAVKWNRIQIVIRRSVSRVFRLLEQS